MKHDPVTICEVSPRDGLQNDPASLTTAQKVDLITRAVNAGIGRVEAVSFVNPTRVPQMADAADVMSAVPRADCVSYAGLVMNDKGLDRAVAAKVDEVNIVIVATDTFCQRNQNMTTKQAVITASAMVQRAKQAGLFATLTVGAAFGCPFEGEVPLTRLSHILQRVVDLCQPSEIALADTIGVAGPSDITERLTILQEVVGPSTPSRLHLHDTRNTGIANAVAAVQTGVRTLDASLGGLGGCPFAPEATGNIATEDLLYVLGRMGIETGASIGATCDAARWLSTTLAHSLPSALLRAGMFPPEPVT